MPITEFDKPFDMVGIDIMGPFPETIQGNKYIVNLSDYSIKCPEAFAMKDAKSETIANIYVDEIISRTQPHENCCQIKERIFCQV